MTGSPTETPKATLVGSQPSNPADQDGASKRLGRDSDNRPPWDAKSRYPDAFRRAQTIEGIYFATLIGVTMVGLATIILGFADSALKRVGCPDAGIPMARNAAILGLGGLLGGTVYGAKWLYHAVAKGLWHEDRQMWRWLSPLISVGATAGVGAAVCAGLFPAARMSLESNGTGTTLLAVGFAIGYFTDRALAKMKELTDVLFGESRDHEHGARERGDDSHQK